MIPTNYFVKQNKQKINQFLNNICQVDDFYESLEMDQYMALSRKDLSIQITPNEIYSTHALLSQYKSQLISESSHRLVILIDELGPVPPLIQRKRNHPIRLALYNRWETNPTEWDVIPQPLSPLIISQKELLYMETKSTFVQILRGLPNLLYHTDSTSLDLTRIAQAATLSKDHAQKGTKAKHMLAMLDDHVSLAKDIKQELNHLEDLRKRVVRETRSLTQVFQIIQDHNRYLKSQLETYQTYLQNVRMQAESGRLSTSDIETIKKIKKKYSHHQLEKDGVIVETEVPDDRKPNIFLMIQSTGVGAFIISLHYKGREKPILEIDLKLDDLLEKVRRNKCGWPFFF